MKQYTLGKLKKLTREVKLLTLDISYRAHTGHIGSALSISDILTSLYFTKMRISKNMLADESRDRFILSKGHAAAALYAVLYKKGILTKKQLNTFARDEGGLCEHPILGDPGIEMTTGSLGHGLAFGAGIAWGIKVKSNDISNVYVLISDGECGEGSVWEGAMFASRMKLDNLAVIVDYDKWQCFGPSEKITSLKPLASKWRAFGWQVMEVDGHDLSELSKTYSKIPLISGKPSVIIAHTTSGHGISQIENQLLGHYKIFNEEEYRKARKELL